MVSPWVRTRTDSQSNLSSSLGSVITYTDDTERLRNTMSTVVFIWTEVDFYQEGNRLFLNCREYMEVICQSAVTLLTYPAIKHNFDFDGVLWYFPFSLKMGC